MTVSDVPQTIQDAIFMTRALGFKYIWVDSVCILQDDADDWSNEASRMVNVYSEAWLVLAATQASDSALGFLHPRPETLVLGHKQHGAKNLTVHARRAESHDCDMRSAMTQHPLYQRAWCMQERTLARRIVHFLPDELVWHCKTTMDCECGLMPTGLLPPSISSIFRSLSRDPIQTGIGPTFRRTWYFLFGKAWASIIKEYIQLKITRDTDALPALSGLAQSVQEYEAGQYIAGLWERDIAYLLSWRLNSRAGREGRQRVPLSRPTFSWITAIRAVQWPVPDGEALCGCTFVSATTLLATANPYGHVDASTICLRGPLLLGNRLKANATIKGATSLHIRLDTGHSDFYDYSGYPLDKSDGGSRAIALEWDSLACFGLWQHHGPHSDRAIEALLLQRQEDGSAYIRSGVVSRMDWRLFKEYASEQTVTVM
jgi:hypothetical protein